MGTPAGGATASTEERGLHASEGGAPRSCQRDRQAGGVRGSLSLGCTGVAPKAPGLAEPPCPENLPPLAPRP